MAGRDWLLAAVVVALLANGNRRRPDRAAPAALGPQRGRHHHVQPPRARVVDHLRAAGDGVFQPDADRHPVRPDELLGTPRVHHAHAHAAGDHRALFWVFFFFTPLQYVLVALRQLRAVQHFDSGLRVPVHSGPRGAGRRLQAVLGARGEDPIGPDDLRVLPELCTGAACTWIFPTPATERRRRGCCSSS